METNSKKRLERDIEVELGDDYVLDLKKNYDIEGDQKFDVIPEIWNGRNIADYIDPDILKKLEALEREEEQRINDGFYDNEDDSEEDDETKEMRGLAKRIRERKAIMKVEQRMNQTNKPKLPRNPRKVSIFSLCLVFVKLLDNYLMNSFTKTKNDRTIYVDSVLLLMSLLLNSLLSLND